MLTSSLVLSIWSADGSSRNPWSWKRRIVINDALKDYFKNDTALEGSVLSSRTDNEAKMKECIRLRTRARAFTWAPALPNAEYPGSIGTQPYWGQHIIAVANDDNHIALVIVESPTSTFEREETWNAEVLNHFTVIPDSESIFSAPETFDDIMKQQRYISHIAWSPWSIQGKWFHSVLAYATNDDIRLRIITYIHDTIGLGDEVVHPNSNLRHKGPLKWSPRIQEGNKVTLAVFGGDGLSVLTVSMLDAKILECKTHDLDGRWDEVSGAVWDDFDSSPTRIHFSSLHSTLSYPTAVIEVSDSGLVDLPSPNWREQISDTQALYSAQNDLGGNAKSKVWGLCKSPLGDFIAACHTAHPSDMLEYGPPKERNCAVAISNTDNYSKNRQPRFPVGNVSAEGIVFTLRRWLDDTVEDTNQVSSFAEGILNNMIQTYAPLQKGDLVDDHDESYSSTKMGELTKSFKRYVVPLQPQHRVARASVYVAEC